MPISILLVRPLYSGNLGSVARAMKNMGLSELRLIDPRCSPKDQEAYNMAPHARDLLQKAKTYSDLPKALRGFDWVIGTSRRKGGERSNWRNPREMVIELAQDSARRKVAWVFGPEDAGLSNEELQHCQRLVHIPSHPKCPSLNLAQAVMVLAYEWHFAQQERKVSRVKSKPISVAAAGPKPAPIQSLEGMYADLQALLGEIGFLNKQNPRHLIKLIRNLFNRARPSEKEVKIVRGICRQVRWWGKE